MIKEIIRRRKFGVYLLLGRSADRGRLEEVYIGESCDLDMRIAGHKGTKTFQKFRAFLLHRWPKSVSKKVRIEKEARFIQAADLLRLRMINKDKVKVSGSVDEEMAILREIVAMIEQAQPKRVTKQVPMTEAEEQAHIAECQRALAMITPEQANALWADVLVPS